VGAFLTLENCKSYWHLKNFSKLFQFFRFQSLHLLGFPSSCKHQVNFKSLLNSL
jgi:hypothetical protein